MEELAEGLLKGILRLIGAVVRALIWLSCEIFFETISWYVGWPICRVISFGHYLRQAINEYEEAGGLSNFIVTMVGFVCLVLLAIFIAGLVGSG